ncbi:MAG: hypothetical protein RI894_107, partial [Bacteroidota bacterium]
MAENFVITTTKSAAEQTKAQKAFYTHLKKIDKLKAELVLAQETISYFAKKKGELLIPAEQALADMRANWLRLLFRWRDNPALSLDLVQTITQTIVQEGYELINVFNYNDLIPMYDECAAVDYETEAADAEAAQKQNLKEMLESMGIEVEGEVSEENIFEHIATAQEKLKELTEAEAERKANRKKTAKQQKKAEEMAVQKAIETKSVREIYMKLAKEFHPDTEPEETERLRKTEVMQRITGAYEANDLPGLLRLQLEYEQISLDKLDELADTKLVAYNNVLKGQIKQLEQEKQTCAMQLTMQNPELPPYMQFTQPSIVDSYMKKQVREMQATKRQIE